MPSPFLPNTIPTSNNPYANAVPVAPESRVNHQRLAPLSPPPAHHIPGRVRLLPNEQLPPYQFSITGTSTTQDANAIPPVANLGAMQQPTALSRAYFSPENAQIVQNALRKQVHDATGTVVQEQDVEQLQLVMRSVFLQYSRNQTHSADIIREQIQEMNTKVVDYCVPNIVSNLKQHQHYLKDVRTLPMPWQHVGQATSQAGSRSLELKPFI